MTPYLLELPFPPSLNGYYMNAARKTREGKRYTGRMISPEGVRFRGQVVGAVRAGHRMPPKLTGRLSIIVLARPPAIKADGKSKNGNRRDLDNLWKCLLDAMTKAEVFQDDALFDDVRMVRGNPFGGGRVWVSIRRFDPDASLAEVREAGIVPPPERELELALPF